MNKILIIEDNKKLVEELSLLLKKYDYNTCDIHDFYNAIDEIKQIKPDLILLDINLPYFDGFHFCRKIREFSDIPIIFLTSRDNTADEILAMTIGGDDYITKPYDNQVLLTRIAAVLKRYNKTVKQQEIVEVNGIKLITASNMLEYLDKSIELTKNEQKLLLMLLNNAGAVVSRSRLMEMLWDSDVYVDENTLSVNITRLRDKLSLIGLNDCIQTVRGQGYIIR